MIKIEKMELGPVTVMRVMGEIDEEGVNALRVSLLDCIKAKRCQVVVNLSDVRYISYMGIGVLVERRRQLMAAGGDMKLAQLNLSTKRALHMSSVMRMFSIYETEALAMDGFKAAA